MRRDQREQLSARVDAVGAEGAGGVKGGGNQTRAVQVVALGEGVCVTFMLDKTRGTGLHSC